MTPRARAAALLVAGAACTAGVAIPGGGHDEREDDHGLPACVVATWDGGSLRMADVNLLRAELSPAPRGATAVRWAIDVHLAARETGPAESDPPALLDAYRRWLDRAGAGASQSADPSALRKAVHALHDRAKLRRGWCHPDGATPG